MVKGTMEKIKQEPGAEKETQFKQVVKEGLSEKVILEYRFKGGKGVLSQKTLIWREQQAQRP